MLLNTLKVTIAEYKYSGVYVFKFFKILDTCIYLSDLLRPDSQLSVTTTTISDIWQNSYFSLEFSSYGMNYQEMEFYKIEWFKSEFK